MGETPAPRQDLGFAQRLFSAIGNSNLARVLRYRDFRLLWFGAFLSFTGSFVQNVSQGYYVVYNLHENEQRLSFVSFCWSIPVFLFGLTAGSITDILNKRTALVWTQILYFLAAAYLAISTWLGFVTYGQIAAIAFLNGCIACIEMPTRQTTVGQVVPPEDLAIAVPINAMTFNVARIVGPVLGGILLAKLGVAICYFTNALSFLALVWAAQAIRADLRSQITTRQPIGDLVREGFLYAFRDVRLRTLFILETITGFFGLAYVALLPSYAKEHMHLGKVAAQQFLPTCYTAIGIGAMLGLLLMTQYSGERYRAFSVRFAMWGIGIGLCLVSLTSSLWVILPFLALIGMCTLLQFNTTNALFQLLAPEQIRGRVLAMHIWSLNGLSPFGVLAAGWLATYTRVSGVFPGVQMSLPDNLRGTPLAMLCGGAITLVGAVAATIPNEGLRNLKPASR